VLLLPLQADTATSGGSPADGGASRASPLSEAGSASPASTPGYKGAPGQEEQASCSSDDEGAAEGECTIVHNGMVITHVPASQVSKVGVSSLLSGCLARCRVGLPLLLLLHVLFHCPAAA
jgi:hypothetical protein